MNRISAKLLSIFAIFLFIAILPIAVLATNEDVCLVSKSNNEGKTEYIIYLKNYTDKKFKYAFTTNANPEEMDLSYINSISDLGGNQVAFLDATTKEKLSVEDTTIYLWAKDENENLILKGTQLDLNINLSQEDLENTENITKRIQVNIADTQEDTTIIREENIDGVQEIATVGYVKIIDDENAKYYYERIKLPNLDKYNELMELVQEIKTEYNEIDIYEKVQIATKFNEIYSKVINEAEWQEIEGNIIEQPEESKEGDQYIVLLKKVDSDGKITVDAQFLTAFDAYIPEVIKEEIVKQETAKLPITYDSIALFVILVIIVILIIAVFIRIKLLKNKDSQVNEEE